MKYLLDSLQSYDMGHSDALCPVPLEADQSFMGDHLLVRPVATEEFRSVTSQIITHLTKISLNPPACVCCCHPPDAGRSVPSGSSQLLASSTGDRTGRVSAQLSLPNRVPTPPLREESPVLGSIPISDRVAIIPGVAIPNLKKGETAWLDAIQQWEHGDAAKGLMALRDWPAEWYTGGMRRVTGSKRSQRKLIFDEFERCASFIIGAGASRS
jgi:hypothetical protein